MARAASTGQAIRESRESRRSRPVEFHVLRLVPGNTPIHRLWAGTKVLAVIALSIALTVTPTWPALAVVGTVLVAGIGLARIPRGATPHFPRWLWVAMGIGWLLSFISSRKPLVHIAGMTLSWGAGEEWLRLTVLGVMILALALLLSWTTPLAEIAPALAKLGAPLRWVRLPVDELAVAVALGTRCLPLLIDEVRTLLAARRLRHRPGQPTDWRSRLQEPHLLLSAALLVALRRAAELSRAIEARGGVEGVTVPSADGRGPTLADVVALLLVAAAVAGTLLV
jgi:energy-coupling factor transporter transmembrane protein EcfT